MNALAIYVVGGFALLLVLAILICAIFGAAERSDGRAD